VHAQSLVKDNLKNGSKLLQKFPLNKKQNLIEELMAKYLQQFEKLLLYSKKN